MNDKTYSRVIRLIFTLNTIFLIWAILWKCGIPFIGDGTGRVINLIPFCGNTGWEMQFNILLFVPFGFLLSSAMRNKLPRQIFAVVFTSVLMEAAQYILAVGIFVTDMEKMVSFYRDILGMQTDWDGKAPNAELESNGFHLTLYRREDFEKETGQKYTYPEGINGIGTLSSVILRE